MLDILLIALGAFALWAGVFILVSRVLEYVLETYAGIERDSVRMDEYVGAWVLIYVGCTLIGLVLFVL